MNIYTLETIKPLVHNVFEAPNGIRFSSSCFEGKDWSLAPMQEPDDPAKHPEFAHKLARALGPLGVKRAYAPNPVPSNGEVISSGNLNKILGLPGSVFLLRNKERPADSTSLNTKGDAGIFSAGGCGKVVLISTALRSSMLFGHASRESLLDRLWVRTRGKEASRGGNVIDNMIAALDTPPEEVHAWVLYFIKPQDFIHRFDDPDPNHAEYNTAAAAHLPKFYGDACGTVTGEGIAINLPGIAKANLMAWGVPEEQIHMEHCYLSDELPTTRRGGGRYLAATVRLN